MKKIPGLIILASIAVASPAVAQDQQTPPPSTTSTAAVTPPPEQPAQPAQPEQPAQPAQPEQPAAQPAQPAQPAEPAQPAQPAAETKPAEKKPSKYNIPWQLRGVKPAKLLRIESAVALFDVPNGAEPTWAGFLTGAYPITPELGVFARLGFFDGTAPSDGTRASGLSNPAVGGLYSLALTPELRLAGSLTFTLPFGDGGGDHPDVHRKMARAQAVQARSSLDNAMYGVNDIGIVPGIDIAWLGSNVTLQAEANVIFAVRVRGEMDQPDTSKINFVSGLHFGYYMVDWLSLGSELRYQYWFKPPKATDTSKIRDSIIGQGSLAVGPRFHFKTGESAWFHPGIAYVIGLDDPMSGANYQVIFVDLPVTF